MTRLYAEGNDSSYNKSVNFLNRPSVIKNLLFMLLLLSQSLSHNNIFSWLSKPPTSHAILFGRDSSLPLVCLYVHAAQYMRNYAPSGQCKTVKRMEMDNIIIIRTGSSFCLNRNIKHYNHTHITKHTHAAANTSTCHQVYTFKT